MGTGFGGKPGNRDRRAYCRGCGHDDRGAGETYREDRGYEAVTDACRVERERCRAEGSDREDRESYPPESCRVEGPESSDRFVYLLGTYRGW